MSNKRTIHQHRCPYCGKFFKPDHRTKDWQISCRSKECQRMRKKASQRKWLQENPDYFTGRYCYIKEWRKSHSHYQQIWRSKWREKKKNKSVVKSIRLIVSETLFQGDLHEEIRLVKHYGCGFFVSKESLGNTPDGCMP